MKKTIALLFFLSFSIIGKSQDLTISVAPTLNNVYHYRFVAGGPSGNYKLGINTSIEYLKPKDKNVSFGYGLSFQRSNVEIVPEPFIGGDIHTETVNLISGSLKVIFSFQKEYYLSVDPLLDLQLKNDTQVSIDNQTGLGLSIGIGKRIPVSEGILINIEPRLWVHNIVPFIDNNLPFRLTVFGFKAGISFRKN